MSQASQAVPTSGFSGATDGADWQPAGIMEALERAVYDSGRWRKWLQPDETPSFRDLSPERRDWLVQTGARYIWTQPEVDAARGSLYRHMAEGMPDAGQFVVARIARSMEKYVGGFRLFGSNRLLGG